MQSKVIRCAIYTRKSTEEGLEQDFNSLQAQREACEAYIKSQKHEGWQLIKTHYDDGGFSGGNTNRPALQKLLQDIEAGRIDVIVVYKVDRLSRSLHDFAKMVEVFDRHNVSFVSVTQQFNTTSSMGRLTLNVLLSFAQFEREVTSERIRDKVAASKKKGMWMGGVIPLGYDVVDKKLTINPKEAETVRYIFRTYLELGSVRKLSYRLKNEGVVTKPLASRKNRGAPFTRPGLYHLLSNHTYTGQVHFKGVSYPGLHEAIIDPELFESVQKAMIGNRTGFRAQYTWSNDSPLKGKLFDAATGEALAVTYSKRAGRRYRYYLTRELKIDTRTNSEHGWRLQAAVIEKTVDSIVRTMLAERDNILTALKQTGIPEPLIPSILDKIQTALKQEGLIAGDFIKRVSIGLQSIEVTISLTGAMPSDAQATEAILIQKIAMQMRRRNNEMRLVLDGTESTAGLDTVLVKGLAQAHVWTEELFSGKVGTLKELAQKYNVSDGYLKKLMPLAFLAPDIVLIILAGKQSDDVTKEKLVSHNFSHIWNEQLHLISS